MLDFDFHYEPSFGWINDPNGLVFFRGQYHAFFQRFPYAPVWGPMHWGHAVSDDLIHWTDLPMALVPDLTYENEGGCFSGSAVVKDDRLYLFYTSVSHHLGQTQSMAYSDDGIHFTKYKNNPVIPLCPVDSGYPRGSHDFRDPKVQWINGHYYMVTGTHDVRTEEGKILLFQSDDLYRWEFVSVLLSGKEYGFVPECPDLFPLGDKYVLMYSQMGVDSYMTRIFVGDFDGKHFSVEKAYRPEAGPDFYAPQSLEGPDGRRILIGWHYHWGKALPEGYTRAGALSLPREMTLENGQLKIRPVKEARSLLKDSSSRVKVEDNTVTVTDGIRKVICKTFPKIDSVSVLEDTKSTEVFVNGDWNASVWLDDSFLA